MGVTFIFYRELTYIHGGEASLTKEKLYPVRLVAIDLDDTLLEEDLIILDETIHMIRLVMERGTRVVIATGRMYQSALPYAKQLGLDGLLITYNGGLIRHVSGETLDHMPVPEIEATALIEEANDLGLRLNFYINDELYVAEVDDHVRYYQSIAGVDVFPVGDLARAFQFGEPTKCLFVGEEERVDRLLPYFQSKYPSLQITRSKPRFIEVTQLGVHKGAALQRIAEVYGLSMESVAAIGDNDNDISMIERAGFGIAVSNASDGAKRVADVVTDRARGMGVVEALRSIFS